MKVHFEALKLLLTSPEIKIQMTSSKSILWISLLIEKEEEKEEKEEDDDDNDNSIFTFHINAQSY